MTKILTITLKTLREAWREPQLTALLLLFPALLVVIYASAYGQAGAGMAQMLTVTVLNQDAGPSGTQLVQAMQDARFDNAPVFTLFASQDRGAAETALWERKATLLLIIPPDFSAKLAGGPAAGLATLQIVGDTSSDLYIFSSSFVMDLADGFVKKHLGLESQRAAGIEFLPHTGTVSDFQASIPGVLVFGVMFAAISAAMVLVREDVSGTLSRMRLARLSAAQVLMGIALAQLGLVVLQLLLAFATAQAMGFKSPGSLPLAVGVALLLGLSAIGLGLIAACFSHNDGEAATLATLLMAVPVFLSGAIFPMPPAPLGTLAGQPVSLYDIFPTAHATRALLRVLVHADGPAAITYELVSLALLSGLILLVGIGLYHQLRLKQISPTHPTTDLASSKKA